MPARNDITKDKIQTPPNSDDYREGWDVVWGTGKQTPCPQCGMKGFHKMDCSDPSRYMTPELSTPTGSIQGNRT